MMRAGYFFQGAVITAAKQPLRTPVVSVILPTFCRGDNGLLARAIESVLRQRLSDFELLVADDGSVDSTRAVIAEYQRSDSRIVHIRHDRNCGLPALRVNEALLLARGAFCAYQFDDDQWEQDHLSTLVGSLQANQDFGVAYAKCQMSFEGRDSVLGGPFNYSQLLAGNTIANNTVVHRREVFERLGGYDMHILIRRLCDWDLWLRWGREQRFFFVDEVLGHVDAGLHDSIGHTAAHDPFVTRAHMASDRTARLRPAQLADYEVDDLGHLAHLGQPLLEETWRRQIAEFQSRFRDVWASPAPPAARPRHVLVTKAHFDTTVDITIGNFRDSLAGRYAFTFIPQAQVTEQAVQNCDVLLLHRTIDQHALELLSIAKAAGKAVLFLMDDDLMSLHEVSAEFSYLAPGAPCRIALEKIVEQADLVITYSPPMRESVQGLNPRNVLLDTNIQAKWVGLARDRIERGAGRHDAGRRRLRIAFAGGGARKEEFDLLWPALTAASRSLEDRAEFHFWGFQPDGLRELSSPYFCEPFSFSYDQYLGRLSEAGFDLMIAPLLGERKAKRAKCPIKFLEAAAAGAVGIYSDESPYRAVEDGITGFKCANTESTWREAIMRAALLPAPERRQMALRALDRVEREFMSERQADRVGATIAAGLLHSLLPRSAAGKPRVAYLCHSPYLGGAEMHLLRHLAIAREFGLEPLLAIPEFWKGRDQEARHLEAAAGVELDYLPLTVETECPASRDLDGRSVSRIQSWLEASGVSLVHSVTLMREAGEAARGLGLPHVASLYATESTEAVAVEHCNAVHSDSLLFANRWGEVLGAPAYCILSPIPVHYFDVGEARRRRGVGPDPSSPVHIAVSGTLQPRKGQLNAIEALGSITSRVSREVHLHLFGYDRFYPEYVEQCWQAARDRGVADRLHFEGFVSDPLFQRGDIDVLLCSSDWESLPQAILEAMACRVLVVAPKVGGIGEVVSELSGILMPGNSPEQIAAALDRMLALGPEAWSARVGFAFEFAHRECSRYPVAAKLFEVYIEAERRSRARPIAAPLQPAKAGHAGAHAMRGPEPNGNSFGALSALKLRLSEINRSLQLENEDN